MDVFDLAAKIRLDTSEYDKGLSDASSKTSSFVSSLGNGLKTAAKAVGAILATGATALGGAAVGLTKQATDSYARYEQLVGGIETLFKNSADTVMRYAESAYQTSGLSANDYMEQTIMFSASLIQGLKGDTEAAADIANMAIIDMSDNVNKMGTSMEMVQNAYRGLARQNFTMLDNLSIGYQGTAAEMARLINDSGVMGDTFKATAENVKEISFDKYIEAIHVIQTQMGISGLTAEDAAEMVANGVLTQEEAYEKLGTTAKEAEGTIEGSAKAVRASWSNVITGLANGNANIGSLIDIFIRNVEKSADNLLPTIERAVNGVITLAGSFIEKAPALINKFLPTLTNAITSLTKSVTKALPGLIKGGGMLISALVDGILDNSDEILGAVGEVIDYLVDSFAEGLPSILDKGTDIIVKIVDGIVKGLPKILPAISKIITNLSDGISRSLPKLIEAGGKLLDSILSVLTDPKSIKSIIDTAISFVKSIGSAILEAIPTFVKTISQAVPQIISGLVDIVISIVNELPTIISGLLDALPGVINMLIDTLTTNLPTLIEGLIKIVGAVIENAPKILQAVIDNADKIITALIDGIIIALPMLVDGAIELILGLVKYISENAGKIADGAMKLILKIAEVLSDPKTLENLLNAGLEIVSSLIGAMVTALPQLATSFLNFAKSFISSAWDGIKKAADDIKRVGEWIGDKIGVALGIKDAEEVGKKYANGILKGATEQSKFVEGAHSSGGGGNTFSGGGRHFSVEGELSKEAYIGLQGAITTSAKGVVPMQELARRVNYSRMMNEELSRTNEEMVNAAQTIILEVDKQTFGKVTYQQNKMASAIRGKALVDVGLSY